MTTNRTSEPFYTTGLEHHVVEGGTADSSIPITIFYPCTATNKVEPARYTDILGPCVDETIAACLEHLDLDPQALTEMTDHAKSFRLSSVPAATPDTSKGPCPVILYSPGGDAHRFTNVPLLERIAAAGYVVVTIDHPNESTPFVDVHGSIRRIRPTKSNFIKLTLQRVKDVRLVLDYLCHLARKAKYGELLDAGRIGMFGHSRGGYVATLTQAEDSRIQAVGNIDGFLYGYWTQDGGSGIEKWPTETQQRLRGSTVPFLRIRGRVNFEDADILFQYDVKDFSGDFNFVIIQGWSHDTFATSPMFRAIETCSELHTFCSVGLERNIATLSRIVVEFFDIYLKDLGSRTYLEESLNAEADVLVKVRLMKQRSRTATV